MVCQLAVECSDTRVCVQPHPADPAKIKAKPIPPEVLAAFNAG